MADEQQDFTDPIQHKKRIKKHKLREAREKEDIIKVLDTSHGRRLLWRILDQSKLLAPDMFTGQNNFTNHNLGKRDLGLWLYNEIMGSEPKAFIKMMDENLKELTNG
jgi:hypothetical protein